MGKAEIKNSFTLIELIIAIAISTMIAAAMYLSLQSGLETWQITQDELLLQQVSSRIMEELTEGLPDAYGLRDGLEIVDAGAQKISVVMPWTDDTHSVYSGVYTYTLNKHIKPGTALPIAEALLPETKGYRVLSVALVDAGKKQERPEVFLKMAVPAGSQLRFTFHPDYKKDADVITTIYYDGSKKAIFIEDKEGTRDISENIFAVKITDFIIRYFDNTNTEVGINGNISKNDIPNITGLEIAFKAESKNLNKRETTSFVSLRNAMMTSGNLILREGSRFSIPDSNNIKALALGNISGIDNEDKIVLQATPQSGTAWKMAVQFSRPPGGQAAFIDSYTIEYPPGEKVYFERPRLSADFGLNLLNLSPNGSWDYDDDGLKDSVILKGKVVLEVKQMDIGGAALFVKP